MITPQPTYQVNSGSGSSGVASFNTRTGAVTLQDSDIESTFGAEGDLYVGTGSGTGEKLGIGTSGQVLTVGGSDASGLEWATPASGALSYDSGTLASNYTATTSETAFLTTNSLAVGKWLITCVIDSELGNSTSALYFRCKANSATATFSGAYSQLNGRQTTVPFSDTFNFIADITVAGTLDFTVEVNSGGSGTIIIGSGSLVNYQHCTGYTAVKIA